MPSQSFTVSRGPNVEYVGDTRYESGSPTNFVERLYLAFGVEFLTGAIYGTLLTYSTSIPPGARIKGARLTFKSNSDNSVAVQARVAGITQGDWSSGTVQDPSSVDYGFYVKVYDTAGAEIGGVGSSAAFAEEIRSDIGIDAVGQTLGFSSSGNDTLGSAKFYLDRVGSDPSGLVWVELWTIAGSDGAYSPAARVASSDNVAFDSISTTAAFQSFTFTGSQRYGPLIDGATPADVHYVLKLVTSATLDSDSRKLIVYSDPGYDGSTNNSIRFGSVGGFSRALYPRRNDLDGIASLSGAVGFAAPTLADDTSYSWGSASFSPDLVTDAFSSAIQACVDSAGYAGNIGIRVDATSSGFGQAERRMYAADEPTEAGPVLEVEWSHGSISISPGLTPAIGGVLSVGSWLESAISVTPAVGGVTSIGSHFDGRISTGAAISGIMAIAGDSS